MKTEPCARRGGRQWRHVALAYVLPSRTPETLPLWSPLLLWHRTSSEKLVLWLSVVAWVPRRTRPNTRAVDGGLFEGRPRSCERERHGHLEGKEGQSGLWSRSDYRRRVLILRGLLWSLRTLISELSTWDTPIRQQASWCPQAFTPSSCWIVCVRLQSRCLGSNFRDALG